MNGKNTDYEKYQYSVKEIIRYVSECVILCLVVDYLFYKNIWMLLLAVPLPVLYLKWKKKQLIRERKRRLNYQFRDALNSMSVAVQAGYSVENAVSACVRDLEQLYEKNADIAREFRYIENQQKVSVPVEDLFLDLGKRCRVEDIENFASILYTAKRSGGDLGNVIQKVARMLGDKIDVKKEIESKKIRADDHEPYAGRNYSLSSAGISGISGYALRQSLWHWRHVCLPGCIWNCVLDGQENCGNRGVADVAPYCHFCYIISPCGRKQAWMAACGTNRNTKGKKAVFGSCIDWKYNGTCHDLYQRRRRNLSGWL